MATKLVLAALDMALAQRQPPAQDIYHSDQGGQYETPICGDIEPIGRYLEIFPERDPYIIAGSDRSESYFL